jgi:hypothetical protein
MNALAYSVTTGIGTHNGLTLFLVSTTYNSFSSSPLLRSNKLECFELEKFFRLSLTFESKTEAYPRVTKEPRGLIFSCLQPFYERAVSDLDRPMHRSLWVYVAHSSFIEDSHMTKNTVPVFTNFTLG